MTRRTSAFPALYDRLVTEARLAGLCDKIVAGNGSTSALRHMHACGRPAVRGGRCERHLHD